VRYWNNDVLGKTEDVLEDVLRVLEAMEGCSSPPSQPSPASGGRG
jgi:very-short-patch-repair endonuclease